MKAPQLARGSISSILPNTQYSNYSPSPESFGAGLGRDLQQVGAEIQQREEIEKQKRDQEAKSLEKFGAAKRFAEEGLYAQQDLQERTLNAPLGAPDFTPTLLKDYEERHKGILEGLRNEGYSEEVIQEMDLNLTSQRQALQAKGYEFETTSRVEKVKGEVEKVGLDLSQLASASPAEMESALQTAYQTIDDLPGIDAVLKQKLKDEQRGIIVQAAGFGLAQQEPMTVLNLLTGGAWSAGRGQPLVAQDLPSEANILLNVISGTESPGYNVKHGGATFSDYSQHPNSGVTIQSGPHAGKTSTAAGKYQFIKGTWDTAAAALGLQDFSPENQDRAAWWLAQHDYRNNTGRDLVGDMRSGNFAAIRQGLGSTWEGLAKISDASFAKRMTGEGGDVSATAVMIDGKTGNPVLDALDATQRRAVLSAAQTQMNQQQVAYSAELGQRVENASAAYMTTGNYDGQVPTQQEFYRAYAPAVAEQKWKEFQGAVQTGAFVQDMRTMSASDIAAQLATMAPTNTASPTYAREVENFNAAQTAAKNTMDQRSKDPAGYVTRNYPAAAQAWQSAMSGEGPMSGAFTMMQTGYEQLGMTPDQWKAWPEDVAKQQVVRYGQMSPEQKIGFVTDLRQNAGQLFPAALRQLSENGLPAEAYLSSLVALDPTASPAAANAIRGLQLMEQDPTRAPKEAQIKEAYLETLGASQGFLPGDYTSGIYRAAMGLYVANGGPPEVDVDLYNKSLQQILGAEIYSSGSVPTLLPPGTNEESFDRFRESLTMDDLTKLSRNREAPLYATGETASASDIADEGTFVRIGPSSYTIVMESDGQPLLDSRGQRFVLLLDKNAVEDIGAQGPITPMTPGELGANIGGMIGDVAPPAPAAPAVPRTRVGRYDR